MKLFNRIITWYKTKKFKKVNLLDLQTMIKIQKIMESMHMPNTTFSIDDIRQITNKE